MNKTLSQSELQEVTHDRTGGNFVVSSDCVIFFIPTSSLWYGAFMREPHMNTCGRSRKIRLLRQIRQTSGPIQAFEMQPI